MKEDSEKVKARNKRKTSKAKELGVCYAHLNVKVASGKTLCDECLLYRKERRKELLSKGLCLSCRKPNTNGETKCDECKRRHLASRFGLSEDECVKLFSAQKGCYICGCEWPLVIDHSHLTGQVRGVLCKQCNISLGGAKDNPDTLKKLIDYLSNPPAEQIIGEVRYRRGKIYPNSPVGEIRDGRGYLKRGRRRTKNI